MGRTNRLDQCGRNQYRQRRQTVRQSAGEITAVDDVDIDIGDGEFLVLVGPSGSGKSTLLRMVSGLEHQTDGDIRIRDELVDGTSPRDRDIAMVFQNYALYPNMTIRENMSFGLKMSTDLAGDEIESRVERVARTMNIEHLLDNNPSQISGGEDSAWRSVAPSSGIRTRS